jgi:hypothetical protein
MITYSSIRALNSEKAAFGGGRVSAAGMVAACVTCGSGEGAGAGAAPSAAGSTPPPHMIVANAPARTSIFGVVRISLLLDTEQRPLETPLQQSLCLRREPTVPAA